MLRIARGALTPPLRVWCACALAGAVSILSGPIGLVFALADVVVLAGLVGVPRLLALRRLGAARIVAVVLIAAGVIALIYSRLAGFSTQVGFTPVASSLSGGLRQLRPVLDQAVGLFGSLNGRCHRWHGGSGGCSCSASSRPRCGWPTAANGR